MLASMDQILLFIFFVSVITYPHSIIAHPPAPSSRITVVGVVYCDTCSSNTFSRHSYFLPGADVNIQCNFKASSPRTEEEINFTVNRTTDKNGVYKLEIPHVDGVDCVDGVAIASLCEARLIGSSTSACSVPGLKTTTNEISIKSKQDNLCIYSLNGLSYRPSKRNSTLCGNHKEEMAASLNSSKCIWPFIPPYSFPWPPLSSLPFPPLPPFPSLPFPTLPPFPFSPFPFSNPPPLSFPFPPLPPFPPTPSLFSPPPPPAFNLGDPRTWVPNFPPYSAPSPPAFNMEDQRTKHSYRTSTPPNRFHYHNP